jgi:hypothetical protein
MEAFMRSRWLTLLALLPVLPLAAQNAKPDAQAQPAIGGGMRVTPAQWNAMPTPAGVSFATGVMSFSSQYGSSTAWYASRAVGFPDVYPRHGDIPGAWAASSTSNQRDELVLQFTGALTQEIWVFETYGVGGLFEVDDLSSGAIVPLWTGVPGPASSDEARVLRITLPVARPITALRLVVSPVSVGAYPEIDAVALVPTLAGPQLAPGAVK